VSHRRTVDVRRCRRAGQRDGDRPRRPDGQATENDLHTGGILGVADEPVGQLQRAAVRGARPADPGPAKAGPSAPANTPARIVAPPVTAAVGSDSCSGSDDRRVPFVVRNRGYQWGQERLVVSGGDCCCW